MDRIGFSGGGRQQQQWGGEKSQIRLGEAADSLPQATECGQEQCVQLPAGPGRPGHEQPEAPFTLDPKESVWSLLGDRSLKDA